MNSGIFIWKQDFALLQSLKNKVSTILIRCLILFNLITFQSRVIPWNSLNCTFLRRSIFMRQQRAHKQNGCLYHDVSPPTWCLSDKVVQILHNIKLQLSRYLWDGVEAHKAFVFRTIYLIICCDLCQEIQWNKGWYLAKDVSSWSDFILHNTIKYGH